MSQNKLALPCQLIPPLKQVAEVLAGQGVTAYLVGGIVRDMLLERPTADIDITVDGDALALARQTADALDGKYVPLDVENEVARVILTAGANRWQLDFTRMQGTLADDLARRDFTINAMALELNAAVNAPEALDVIDLTHGLQDIERRVIRAVSDSVFTSDPVRLLRAVRLSAELDFMITGETRELIRQSAHLVAAVHSERLREELMRLLAVPEDGQILPQLDELGLLTAIFPELEAARDIPQPSEHFTDVFRHTLASVQAVDHILHQAEWPHIPFNALETVPWNSALSRHFNTAVNAGSSRRTLMKVAALLHDVAKPQTRVITETGKMRFFGHPEQGAATTAAVMERLRFSTRETKLVELMVRYHMRPTQLTQSGMPTGHAIYRYFRDTGDAGTDILFLSLADHLAARGPNLIPSGWREHCEITRHVLEQQAEQIRRVRTTRLVDGNDLMSRFDLPAGPELRRLLSAAQEAQATGEVSTREESLAYIQTLLADNN